MATSQHIYTNQLQPKPKKIEEEDKKIYQELRDIVSTFPSLEDWAGRSLYVHKEQKWHATMLLMVNAMVAQQHFVARPTDVFLATFPKSGTTWMKALLYAITNRRETCLGEEDSEDNLLGTLNPHECVPILDLQLYMDDKIPDLTLLPMTPRLLSTHVPIQALPESVLRSGCRVVYLWRDPKDTFVSFWHFNKNILSVPILPIEKAFEMFCDGRVIYGPYFEHVLGYGKASREQKNNILFMKYDNLMEHPNEEVMRLAQFVGKPFSDEEIERGVVEDVIDLCSFERLKNVQVNKSGETKFAHMGIKNDAFFRKGKVGDWANHLSAEMGRRLDQIAKDKFSESGLDYATI